jgi:hypothetical protein
MRRVWDRTHIFFFFFYSILFYSIFSSIKERRQLKTFLTQIRSALPFTSDPPVICFWKWIGCKDYKNTKKSQFAERFCQNHIIFVTTMSLATSYTHRLYGVRRQDCRSPSRGSASLAATTLRSQNKKDRYPRHHMAA